MFTACCTVAGEIVRELGAIGVRDVLTIVGVLAFPVAIAVAMLRYRLYDVDRLISRSLTYAAVTILLGARVRAGSCWRARRSSRRSRAARTWRSPCRRSWWRRSSCRSVARVQRFVDRRFYRRRYDATRTLEAFGALVRHEVDLEGLRADLQKVVVNTMHPAHVSVWLFRNDPVTPAPYKGR